MRILVSETVDKKERKYLDIPKKHLIQLLQTDHGYHEVIPMEDPSKLLRVYFDIEEYNRVDMLDEILTILNNIFNTTNNDWAICCGSRDTKISYHIMSKRYIMSLKDLRKLANKIDKPYIDTTAYWFSMNYAYDEGSLRLPNQSKNSINKEGTPMRILQGEISDFFVTETFGLELFIV